MTERLSPRERIERTLDFKDVDTVATGEIIQNSALVSRFNDRRIFDDWTLQALANTYRGLPIDLGMLMAPAARPRREVRNGITYEVSYWSEWVVERPFHDVDGLQDYLKRLILDVKRSDPDTIWSYAGPGGIVGQALEICSDGGFILGASGEIHPAVKAENAIAMFRSAKRLSARFN
jgi:hypothetical protein